MNFLDRLLQRAPTKVMIILQLLIERGEMYGLELVKASSSLKRGTVYVTLNRMEDSKLITSRVVDAPEGEKGPSRRVYKVTRAGVRSVNRWKLVQSAVQSKLKELPG